MENRLELLEELISSAKKAGADEADIFFSEQRSTTVKCRKGELENTGRAEAAKLELRVFIGKKTASLLSSKLDKGSLETLIEQTVAIAKNAPENPHAALVAKEKLADSDTSKLEIWDDIEVNSDQLMTNALEMEEAALAVEGVEQVSVSAAAAGDNLSAICTSIGFSGLSKRTSFSRMCGALAANGSSKEVGYENSGGLFFDDLMTAAEIGNEAGERAAKKLGGKKIKTGQFPVVYAPQISNSLVRTLAGCVAGPAVVSGMSFLKDQLGKQVFAEGINIIDDPLMARGRSSRVYDGEGVACKTMRLIDNGMLTGWMLNQASASQLEAELSGHASPLGQSTSASNLYLEAGAVSVDDLLSNIEFGFYVTETMGHGPNTVTGDYSLGALGFLIENGEITSPVKEATIAGNMKDMFLNMTAADDLEFKSQVNAPTLRVDGMMVAGD